MDKPELLADAVNTTNLECLFDIAYGREDFNVMKECFFALTKRHYLLLSDACEDEKMSDIFKDIAERKNVSDSCKRKLNERYGIDALSK